MSSTEWWRDAVIYQVYPRSFADSDGDGTGDLPGIRSRLPYLRDLGVDAVWLSPSGDATRTTELTAHWTGDRWDLLEPGCLADPDALEMLDERVIGFVPLLRVVAR